MFDAADFVDRMRAGEFNDRGSLSAELKKLSKQELTEVALILSEQPHKEPAKKLGSAEPPRKKDA